MGSVNVIGFLRLYLNKYLKVIVMIVVGDDV